MFTAGGDSLPLTTEQRSPCFGCLDGIVQVPDGAGDSEALRDDLLTAALDSAGTDLVALSPIGRIIHAVLIVGEIRDG